jgi:hypothetical protein
MKKVLCLAVMLAMVATASATVRVFITSSASGFGLENNANAFTPTVSTVLADGTSTNGIDYADYYGVAGPLRPGTYPPVGAPSGDVTTPVAVDPGAFAYVWLQFQNEPKAAKINGLLLNIHEVGQPPADPNNPSTLPPGLTYAWYLSNNLQSSPGIAVKRWDGTATPPGYPEWHNNPQTGVAITSYGIQNFGTSKPDQLFDGTTRIALLGAITAPFDGKKYQIDVALCNYSVPPNPSVAGGVFQFTPEPASLLLMSLAGLLLRRRR